jgi:hypothetical protein
MIKSKLFVDFFISDFDQILGKLILSSLLVVKATFVVLWKSMTVAEHHSASALYSQKLHLSFAGEAF